MVMADHTALKREHDRKQFEYQMEDFIKRWAPDDRYERSQFDAQLISLVRQIYADAQQPVLDQLGKVAMFSPLPPIILKAPE